MRKLAYIETIKSLSPIPNADQIEKAEILGWELVVKKSEFKVGDACIYCEIDSILPELPPFEFLRSKKFRIRTIRLKNQLSQGIAFPLSVINQVDPSFDISTLKVGDDVTDLLKITKYDPEAVLDAEIEPIKKSWLANQWSFLKWKLFGIKPNKRRRDFPSDVPKTDETRVQNMGSALERWQGQPAYISEKLEGASSTFVYRRGGNWLSRLLGNDFEFQICSRNTTVYSSRTGAKKDHHLIQVANKYRMLEVLKNLNRNLAVQGEYIGSKIQGNVYRLSELDLKVFSIFDIDNQRYLPYQELASLVNQLGLSMVPVIDDNAVIKNDIKYYVALSKGKSKINPKMDREGIVVRTLDSSFSFKSINPDYLLKQA